jgi:murein DD-endopeptidase MepM/ murein hydrolase activator NlpD
LWRPASTAILAAVPMKSAVAAGAPPDRANRRPARAPRATGPIRGLAGALGLLLLAAPAPAQTADEGGWSAYLDGVETALAQARDARRLQALSDALRARRDAALAAGRGALPPDLIRRSARLIARLEDARAALEQMPSPAIDARRAPRAGVTIYMADGPDDPARFEVPQVEPPAPGVFVFDWPVDAVHVTSGFGPRSDPFNRRVGFHDGVDLAGAAGDPVRAAGPGRVAYAGWSADGCGNMVILQHADGFRSAYCHLSAMEVDVGQAVTVGDRIGRVGSTGRSTGAHLHWTVHRGGRALDPSELVGKRSDVVAQADSN